MFRKESTRNGTTGVAGSGASGLLEPPFDIDDTLTVVVVCQLTKDLVAQIDIAGTRVT